MSGFLNKNSIDHLGFDWVKPVTSSGNTCDCFIVQIDGKRSFMKKLRQEFSDNLSFRALFRKEYEKGISISHPNIVKYESWHDSTDGCYILMENIVGDTLDKFIEQHPNYFDSRANLDKFFNQLLSALKCLHENHVIYSDFKPQNIMLTQVNNDVKIIDLGFCYTDSYPDSAGSTKGYSAPEHLNQGKLDVATDVFGVGKIIEYIEKKSAKKLPSIYSKIMAKCLKEKQADRWQSIDEILSIINKKTNAWVKWLIISMVAIASLMGYAMWQKSSETTVDISNDIAVVEFLKYSHFNKVDMTCEVIGLETIKHPSIYIRESIFYQGKEYKVTSIANSAFKTLTHIKTVHLPNGLEKIGESAFRGCNNLLVINIPNSVTEIGAHAFYSCKGARDLILSQNLKEIPSASFVATNISRVNIPEGVEVIRLDAFAICENLKEVKIPSTIKHLERGVFFNCLSLQRIELPASLEQTDEYLFFGCDNLKDIYIHAITPPQALTMHRNPSQITLHVPAESVEAYRNAPYWQDMNIVEITEN